MRFFNDSQLAEHKAQAQNRVRRALANIPYWIKPNGFDNAQLADQLVETVCEQPGLDPFNYRPSMLAAASISEACQQMHEDPRGYRNALMSGLWQLFRDISRQIPSDTLNDNERYILKNVQGLVAPQTVH